MIQSQTIVKCIDNTGAKEVLCIQKMIPKKNLGKNVVIFKGAVQSINNNSNIKKSEVVSCLLVRWKKRQHGVQFTDNACIILDNSMKPRATRVFGPIAVTKSSSMQSIARLVKNNNVFYIE